MEIILACAMCLVLCLVTQWCLTLWTIDCQVPLSVGFFRQEYWNELPFPFPGDFPDPGIKPMSPVFPALQVHSLPLEPNLSINALK